MTSVPLFGSVLALMFAGGLAQVQCPAATTTMSPPTTTCGCGGGGTVPGENCLQVNVVDRSVIDAFHEGAIIYYTFVPNTPENAQVDNVCAVLHPVKDNDYTFIYYYAQTMKDGTTHFETYVVSSNTTGINRYANVDYLYYTEYIIGKADCDSYVVYSCGDYGDYDQPYVYGTTTNCSNLPYSDECLQSALDVIQSSGLPVGDYIPLPCKLPNMCQTQHVCLPKSNPLYGAEGGSCAPYEAQRY